MNFFRPAHCLLLPLAWACLVGPAAGQQTAVSPGQVDCANILERMKADFAREPGRLLLSMEDALTTNEGCVCPVVRMAVNFAGADDGLVGQVVVTAVRMAPSAAARVVECATTEAPDAVPAIQLALSRELGEKAPALLASGPVAPTTAGGESAPPAGKAPLGKTPVPPLPPAGETEEVSEDWPAVGVSGIYYAPLSRGSLTSRPKPGERVEKVHIIRTIKITPRRPVSPVTRSSPD